MSLGKCSRCGGEPQVEALNLGGEVLFKVICQNKDWETGYYFNVITAENVWDSWFGEQGGMPCECSDNYEEVCEKQVVEDFGFNDAILYLKNGYSVSRENWNGKGQHLTLQRPDQNSKMSLPYIYITTVQGDRVPWLASQTDMLAEDWYIV